MLDDELDALVGEVVVDGKPVGDMPNAAGRPVAIALVKRDRIDRAAARAEA